MSPTHLTLKHLKKNGYYAGVVEKWIPFIKRRIDFLGAIDILAVRADCKGITGIQATSTSNMSSRVKKALALPAIKEFVLADNKFCVWGWGKRGDRGKRKIWELKERILTKDDFII